jgi:hypothetical protein
MVSFCPAFGTNNKFRKKKKMLKRLNNNPVFRFLDKIPGLRRSGTASLGDLGKALIITLTLCLLVQLPTFIAHPIYFVISMAVLVPLCLLILLAHPFLSHRATLRETFGFKKRSR